MAATSANMKRGGSMRPLRQPGSQCTDIPFDYKFLGTIPLANQLLTNLTQDLDTDADFYLRSLQTLGWAFSLRIQDAGNYYLSNNLIPSTMFSFEPQGGAWVYDPEIYFPAGARIGFDIQDTSGAPGNTVQLYFRGVKRFYV